MATRSFAHLHTHTEYSMLDGAARLEPLFTECARLGMPALAMTDHGNVYGAYEFWKTARKHGIKPIIGMEGYLAPGSRHERTRATLDGTLVNDNNPGEMYTHMTLLAETTEGMHNLFRISSLASLEGMYYKPRADKELLAQYGKGIIATTGCPSGEVQRLLQRGRFDAACQAAADYRDIFGPDSFYLELMDHGNEIEARVRSDLLRLGAKLALPPLATNDLHYVRAADAKAHDVLLCAQTKTTLATPGRFQFEGNGYYLKSPAEMRALWDAEVPGACDNTLLVAEQVNVEFVEGRRDLMPVFPVPEGETEASWLTREVELGLQRRYSVVPDGHRRRVEYELSLIVPKGYSGYFLVVADIVAWARSRRIRVGPGRGSAAGSLVAYALGITGIDPIEHGLLVERLINPERPSLPDIDLDFDERRRGEVVQYAINRYGVDHVAQIITFSTIRTRAALKDAAKALHGEAGFALADRIVKAMPKPVMAKDVPLGGLFDPRHPRYVEASAVRALYATDPAVKEIIDTARGLEDLKRQWGVHACGVIICAQSLLDILPIQRRPDDGAIVTQFDMRTCEDFGLLKVDFLGLAYLTTIDDAVANLARNGVILDMDNLILDDKPTYELLSRGDTLGVFQLDSRPLRDLLRRIEPAQFSDISATLALYRPGPMAANAHLDFADRKCGRKPIAPIHPELAEPLADILADTYGLIVFQEQVMEIAQRVAGYSLGRADLLRKAMGKKILSVLTKERETFASGMRDRGYSDAAIDALWNILLPFADYAFNRSHTAAYGLISYWTAYLKANHPVEYMAALLTSAGNNKDKMAIYLAECRKLGIAVLQPDVNVSEWGFTAVGIDIRFGLAAVRDVGSDIVDAIIRVRAEQGVYRSFSDFLRKVPAAVCNRKVVDALIKAGAFDSLGHPRKGLHLIHDTAAASARKPKRAEAAGQLSLFAEETEAGEFDVLVPPQEWDTAQLLAFERSMLGLYVSDHPLSGMVHVLAGSCDTSIASLLDGAVLDGTKVTVGGLLTGVERKVSRTTGQLWARAELEDLAASVEVVCFAKVYARIAALFTEDAVVLVTGRVLRRDDRVSLAVSEIQVPELVAAGEGLAAVVAPGGVTREWLTGLPSGSRVRVADRFELHAVES